MTFDSLQPNVEVYGELTVLTELFFIFGSRYRKPEPRKCKAASLKLSLSTLNFAGHEAPIQQEE